MKTQYSKKRLVKELERMTPEELDKPMIVKMGDKTAVTGREVLDELKKKKQKMVTPNQKLGSKKSLLRRIDKMIK